MKRIINKNKTNKFAYIAALCLLCIVSFCNINTMNAKACNWYYRHADEFWYNNKDYLMSSACTDYEEEQAWAFDLACSNGFSTECLEDMVNSGFLAPYEQQLKDTGWLPADFNSSASTSSTASSETAEETSAASAESKSAEKTNSSTKEYTQEEIDNAWEVTDEVSATCTEAGYAEYENTITGETKTEEIPVEGHQYEVTEQVDSTCTEKGYITYTCSSCGDSYTEELELAEHNKDEEWTVVEPATFFSDGEQELVCSECGTVIDSKVTEHTCPFSIPVFVGICLCVVSAIAFAVYRFVITGRKLCKK